MSIRRICLALTLTSAAAAQDSPAWPGFRGPAGNGIAVGASHPKTWGEDENMAWSIEVPGSGWSSPVVVGNTIFLTSALDASGSTPIGFESGLKVEETMGKGATKPTSSVTFQVRAYALEDGAELWARDVAEQIPAHGKHPSNAYATETPVTDGESLFVRFGTIGLVVAFDLKGEERWRKDLGVFTIDADFGTGSALAYSDGRVFVQCDNDEESFVVALSASDGEELWRVDRSSRTSWSSPTVWRAGGKEQLVICGNGLVSSYAPTPAFDSKRAYFGNTNPGKRTPLVAVPFGARGEADLEDPEATLVEWRSERGGPLYASPVSAGGFVYVIGYQAILVCHDAETGAQLYKERLPDAFNVVASPWVVGDVIYVLDESGRCHAIRGGGEFEVLGVNTLPGLYWATPSIAGASLLLREARMLHCIRAE